MYMLAACFRVSRLFFFIFANNLIPSMYNGWFIFSYDLLSLYPLVHFLSMGLSGIIAITKSNGDSATLWKILLWIFTSIKLFPLAISSNLQFSIVFLIDFMTSVYLFHILSQSIIYHCGSIIYNFCCQSTLKLDFYVSFGCSWGQVDQRIVDILYLRSIFGILSVPGGTVHGLWENCKSPH